VADAQAGDNTSENLNRRRFLGAAATTFATLALAPVACTSDRPGERTLDTAVIGGGIAGLYAAWRLAGDHVSPDQIAVFEATDRIGGRLLSMNMPGTSGLVAEFGGMRFLTSQRIVTALVQHLGIEVRPFPMGGPENLVYLRGKRWTAADYARPGAISYALTASEAGNDPTALMVKAIRALVPDGETLGPEKWNTVKRQLTLDGRPLSDWGFWEFLNRYLSYEAVMLVDDGGGYCSIPREWNAAEALPWLLADFGNNPEYKTIVKGMDTLPEQISNALQDKGTAVNTGYRLESLRVPSERDGSHELTFATADGSQSMKARRVILAMPQQAIERIPDCPALKGSAAAALLGTITLRPLAKAFIAHAEPWWRRLGLFSGRAVTDLPARQFFYFGTEPGRPAGPSGAATMAYFDEPLIEFWSGMRNLEQPNSTGLTMLDPNGPMVRELVRQIITVHDLKEPPAVLSAGYINWGDEPYVSGWHTWKQGVKSWEVMPAVRTPLPGTDLHIVGEAWSTDQGWIEGALQTVEALLVEDLKLAPPAWLR
jgi:monoamine oxidase